MMTPSEEEAVYFPPISNNHKITDTIAEEDHQSLSFEKACQEAIERKVPLVLCQSVVLSRTIPLKGQEFLHIVGNQDDGGRVTIQGALHSLFLLSNKNQLILEHVDLDHTIETDDHKQVGAAIQLRGKARVTLQHSHITSMSGFCVWGTQNSQGSFVECQFHSTTRSALVWFGQTVCSMDRCQIDSSGVHGLCARGSCHITVINSWFTQNAARAIYAYANASLTLQGCHVSGTIHPNKAAIEVSSMESTTTTATAVGSSNNDNRSTEPVIMSSSLILQDCEIVGNQGVGVRIRGPVQYVDRSGNRLERNAQGDWDIRLQADDDDAVKDESTDRPPPSSTQPLSSSTGGHDDTNLTRCAATTSCSMRTSDSWTLPPLRRDAKGSSFRRGDWLCSWCFQIVAGRTGRPNEEDTDYYQEERCSHCFKQRLLDGTDRLLTMKEIQDCNKGIDFRHGWIAPASRFLARIDDSTIVIWEFDGDDEKGWISYDDLSAQLLEETYQRRRMILFHQQHDEVVLTSPPVALVDGADVLLVNLQGGKYQVNLATMTQINIETQFLRFVRRRNGTTSQSNRETGKC